MVVETSSCITLEAVQMRSWEGDDGLGDGERHGSCFSGTLKEAGQAGLCWTQASSRYW